MKRTLATLALLYLITVIAPDVLGQVRQRRVSKPPAEEAQPARPQATPEELGEGDVLRVNTTLVTVPVSVTDRDGRYIPDLEKEDFRIYEDGVEQQIAYFATTEKPFTVILVLDTSSSVWSKLGQIKEAAIAFTEQLRPDDRVMVVSFAKGFTVQCEPTSDREKIRKAIEGTGRGLSTHLYDAMDKLMRKYLGGMRGRKAVVLFTDGVDASSNDATYESTLQQAEELDALVYPILYDTYDAATDVITSTPPPQKGSGLPSILKRLPIPIPGQGPTITIGGGGSSGSSRSDYDRGERYLRELARVTGGRLYEAKKDLSYLRAAFNHIAEELRRQYSLGYYPRQSARAGERRNIRVRVNRPELSVRSRDSYIFNPQPARTDSSAQGQADAQRDEPALKKKQLLPLTGAINRR